MVKNRLSCYTIHTPYEWITELNYSPVEREKVNVFREPRRLYVALWRLYVSWEVDTTVNILKRQLFIHVWRNSKYVPLVFLGNILFIWLYYVEKISLIHSSCNFANRSWKSQCGFKLFYNLKKDSARVTVLLSKFWIRILLPRYKTRISKTY